MPSVRVPHRDRDQRSTSVVVAWCAILALVLLAVARSAWGTRLDAVTADEPWHIVAGVEYVRTGNYRLNPEHPPLSKLVVGALMPETFRLRPIAAISEKSGERDLVEETFFFDNDFRAAHARARMAMWLLNGTLLFALGVMCWYAFGLTWALVSLSFLAIDPTIAAHLPVVMTDLPVALALGISALSLGVLMTEWRWRWAIVAGVGMGLALGAKHSALPGVVGLGVSAALFAVLQWWRTRSRLHLAETSDGHVVDSASNTQPLSHIGLGPRALQLTTVAGLALLLLWTQYGWHFHAAPDGTDAFNRAMPDKIGDLQIGVWKAIVAFLDRYALIPRAYLWGLADTVRAGVEGRGQNVHLLWGTFVSGSPPWYTWPSFVAIKVPLALLTLSGLGAVSLWRARLTGAAWWSVLMCTVMGATHLLALSRSQGTYAGARHALPLFITLAIVAGAVVWRAHARGLRVAAVGCLTLGLLMTIREPRVWEYHNALAGGTENAWRNFGNEGLDLSQRAYEIADFNATVMASTGKPVYSNYWIAEEEAQALGLRYSRNVVSLADTNFAGIYDGFFIVNAWDQLPMKAFDYDPAEIFRGLTRVVRLGNAEIFRGRQEVPKVRAYSLSGRIVEYIYKLKGDDWALVAKRAEEVIAVLPTQVGTAIELGNAYVRLGRRADAIRAYRQPLSLKVAEIMDDLTRRALQEQVDRLERGDALETIKPIRNPAME